MAEHREKKTEAVTVKMPDALFHFVTTRARQLGMESGPEYIRHLVKVDAEKAASQLNLLAEALGRKVSEETMGAEEK